MCFPVNSAKFLRTSFLTEYLREATSLFFIKYSENFNSLKIYSFKSQLHKRVNHSQTIHRQIVGLTLKWLLYKSKSPNLGNMNLY